MDTSDYFDQHHMINASNIQCTVLKQVLGQILYQSIWFQIFFRIIEYFKYMLLKMMTVYLKIAAQVSMDCKILVLHAYIPLQQLIIFKRFICLITVSSKAASTKL